jgi:hypothetical protein
VRGKLAFVTLLVVLVSGAVSAQTYEFTTCGASGRYGPSQSQCDSAYSGTNLEGEVNVVGEGIQEWTVPEDGKYNITVAGAQGGDTYDFEGGLGAKLSSSFYLKAGENLRVLVGQHGEHRYTSGSYTWGGGGGGTFVSDSSNKALIVGAGGHGAGGDGTGYDCNAVGGSAENTSDSSGGSNPEWDKGDACGFEGYGDSNEGCKPFIDGGIGSQANDAPYGGFGGGGSGSYVGQGAGGGYKGGTGSDGSSDWACGQATSDRSAKSHNKGNDIVSESDTNQVNGYVRIEKLGSKSSDFCNYRGPFNECIMNQTNQLKNQQYNVSSVFEARENAVFKAFSGRATLNITNSTSLSGLWMGEFFIQTEDPRIKPGAEFKPENGDIVVGE